MAPDPHQHPAGKQDSRSTRSTPLLSESLITIVIANPARLLIGTSADDGDYGKHVVEKFRACGADEAPYACRTGTRIQFRRVSGEVLGDPVEVARFTLQRNRDSKSSTQIFITPDSLRSPSGQPVRLPALPGKAAETNKGLITPPRPSAPTQKTVESAPRAAIPTQKQPPAPPVKPPAPPAVISIDISPSVEAAIKQALRQENSDLHIELRKKGAPSDSITWIDAFLAVAEDKYKEDRTPFGKMAQVYLHPLYLRAAHADRRKASEMVDHVASFFIRLKSHNDASVRRFSIDILERCQGEEKDQATQLISGKGLRSLEESLKKLQDPKTPRAALEAVYRDLPSVFSRSFQLMHRATTDAAKREIHDTIRKTLEQSRETRVYQSMSKQQREVFDQSHSETLRRLDSAARQNGMQGSKP